MTCKNYTADLEYGDKDKCFGYVAGESAIIGFHGNSVEQLSRTFEEAVDDYLDLCADPGWEPEKSSPDKLVLCVAPEIQAKAAKLAQSHGMTLNSGRRVSWRVKPDSQIEILCEKGPCGPLIFTLSSQS